MSKRQRQKARQVALSMPRKNGRFVKRTDMDDDIAPIEYLIEEKLDLLLLNMYTVKQRLDAITEKLDVHW